MFVLLLYIFIYFIVVRILSAQFFPSLWKKYDQVSQLTFS